MVEAFDMLARYDPRRLNRFKRDVGGVVIEMIVDACAQWESSCRLVRIDKLFARAKDTVALQIATVLVHEGTHAWLDRRGIKYDAERWLRIEAICMRSELSFQRRVPGGEGMIEQTQQQLALGAELYAPTAYLDRRVARMRQLGFPEFLIRYAVRRWQRQLQERDAGARPATSGKRF
jgi:hypothetical protein